jgi:hypothetical protein
LISFIFQDGDKKAKTHPSLFNALKWLASKTIYFRLTDPQTETFTFHQLLHHKRNLLKDEKELLKSAKRIVVNFITSLKITVEQYSTTAVKNEVQVI